MTRNAARQIAVKLLFSANFSQVNCDELIEDFFSDEHYSSLSAEEEVFAAKPEEKQLKYISSILSLTKENLSEIDGIISRYSSGRRIERISRTALAVLRCALCEILFFDDIPVSVSINEAVEIAKQYDDTETVSYVNGILGSAARNGCKADELSE